MDNPFEMTQDVNGKPVPRWQIQLERMYTANVPFGEMLGYIRYLLQERDVHAIMNASDDEILALVDDPEKLAGRMRFLFEEAVRESRQQPPSA